MILRLLILLGIIVIPACGGSNAELLKLGLLGICSIFWLRTSSPLAPAARWIGIFLVLLAVSTVLSPLTFFREAMIGTPQRAQGLIAIVISILSGLSIWPRVDPELDDDTEPWQFHVEQFAAFALLAVASIVVLVQWAGWEETEFIGRKLGMASILATLLPVVTAWTLRGRWGWHKILGLVILAVGLGTVALSGSRCSLLGSLAGIAVVVAWADLWWNPSRILLLLGVAAVVCLGAIAVDPELRTRVASMGPSSVGHGARSELARQAFDHGIPILGWGWESQRHLIDAGTPGMDTSGQYDRFHCIFVEVLVTSGFIGLLCIAALARETLHRARILRDDWGIGGMVGGLAALLVCAAWNPLSNLNLCLGAALLAGILRTPSPADIPPNHSYSFLARFQWLGLGVLAAVCTGVILTMIVGDRLNEGAKRRWAAHTQAPHVCLARQWLAVKMNPWTERDRVLLYYVGYRTQRIVEPHGGKEMLMALLRRDDRQLGLEALLWSAFGDQLHTEKALYAAKLERGQAASLQ